MVNDKSMVIPDEFNIKEELFGRSVRRMGVLIDLNHFKIKVPRTQNINGPSLLRVPKWIEDPKGKYYLYFAHHKGGHIRIAYAENIEGPYTLYKQGILRIKEIKEFHNHIASPDVHVDNKKKEIRMYFHTRYLTTPVYDNFKQMTYVAFSEDGLTFKHEIIPLARSYLRVFKYKRSYFGLGKASNRSGQIYKSKNGIKPFKPGPRVLPGGRHFAVYRDKNQLHILYSKAMDVPERILYTRIDLKKKWTEWKPEDGVEYSLLAPKEPWEGADLPFSEPKWGARYERVRQLRDPAWYVENGKIYFLYSIAGESGIALAMVE